MDTALDTMVPSVTWRVLNDPNAHSASNAFFSADTLEDPNAMGNGPPATKEDRLIGPAQSLSAFGQVKFWHRVSLEPGFDGAALEVSSDNGATWTDVIDAGGSFAQGAYNGGPIVPTYQSALAGRRVWTGAAGALPNAAMSQVVINLGVVNGSALKFRWRLACDNSSTAGETSQFGWWIDDVEITSPGKSTCPPVAVADDVCVVADTPTKLDVLANDSDPESDPLTIVGMPGPQQITTGAGATAAIVDGGTRILYTPPPPIDPGPPPVPFIGTDRLDYWVSDGHGNVASATVTVNVAATCVVPGLSFYSFTPCRILDTRVPGQGPALTAGTARALPLTGGTCAVPADCKAMSLNITVISPTGNGDLVLYPEPGAAPGASSISFPAGKTRANNAVAGLAAGGDGTTQAMLRITGGGSADLIVDENGCFK